MNECQQQSVQCPYFGELIELNIDCSVSNQSYIEKIIQFIVIQLILWLV
ncbi:CPXCG motif-containing cysteine-rich protein [Candidatus Ruthia endofausta]